VLCVGEYREQVFYLDGFADGYFGLLYPAQSFVKVNSKVLDLIFLGESFTVQK
jgi:hypothetical protein